MELVGSFGSTEAFKAAVKELEAQFDELQPLKDQEVITICPGGGFSLVAAEIMAEAGFQHVKSLAGVLIDGLRRGILRHYLGLWKLID